MENKNEKKRIETKIGGADWSGLLIDFLKLDEVSHCDKIQVIKQNITDQQFAAWSTACWDSIVQYKDRAHDCVNSAKEVYLSEILKEAVRPFAMAAFAYSYFYAGAATCVATDITQNIDKAKSLPDAALDDAATNASIVAKMCQCDWLTLGENAFKKAVADQQVKNIEILIGILKTDRED